MMMNNINNLFSYLMKPEVHVVFDIDGTMGVYLFGDLRHSACNDEYWEQFVTEEQPYTKVFPVPQVQKFVREKCLLNADSVHVCSVSQQFERLDKLNFVVRNYPTIKTENIHFVNSKDKKIELLKELAKVAGSESNVALVDDTVKTLDMIYAQSDFVTVHNSAFMLYT